MAQKMQFSYLVLARHDTDDAFGGGSLMARNVMWSSCRESSDHGVFNSWNRQPFIWEKRQGEPPNLTPQPFVIEHNYFISNYGSGYGVDNDDGSAYFDIRYNVFYGGSGLKSDYAGHDKIFHGNLGIALSTPCGVGTQYRAGHEDHCTNNTIVMRTGNWRVYLPAHNSTQPCDTPWIATGPCDIKQQEAPRCGMLGNAASGARNAIFSYVCPEPVLATSSFIYKNGSQKWRFSQAALQFSRPSTAIPSST